MLKYVISALLVLVGWLAWFFLLDESQLADTLYLPVVWTFVIVSVLAAVWVFRRLRAKRAARALEEALSAQAAEQARYSSRDMQGELQHMRQEFERAVASLKDSKLGRSGANALYELPWQVIIGPPGSGKSTALRNSGLQFPYMSTSGGGVRGLGGTRNCDWWLTNESVLLDTAGRWSTEDDDREDWFGFLDLLKEYRPEKPLNGIVVAVSLADLGGNQVDEVTTLSQKIRERIDEIQSHLQVSLPVYVLFTKADLIPGFVETFGHLSKAERGQIWGFTTPLATPPDDLSGYFGDRFRELVSVQEKRSLKRMSDERKVESREMIHGFAQQLTVLEKNCTMFVSQLFGATAFGPSPMMRGCYITSGTQEGRPIDRVMHKMAEAFGIRGEVELAEGKKEAKSYFLRDVFTSVVFQDTDVATRSAGAVARERRERMTWAGVWLVAAILLLLLPGIAWGRNMTLLDETRDVVDDVSASTRTDGPLRPSQLSALRDRVALLKSYGPDHEAPLLLTLGLYQEDVYPELRNFYVRMLRDRVVRPMVDETERSLDRYGRTYAALGTSRAGSNGAAFDNLKEYLLLTYTRASEDTVPHLAEHAELSDWLLERLTHEWVQQLGGDQMVDAETREAMAQPLGLYLELMTRRDAAVEAGEEVLEEENPRMRFVRDLEVVERARRGLTTVNQLSMALDRIRAMYPPQTALGLSDLVGEVGPMTSGRSIEGAFTRTAWEENVRDLLRSPDSRLFNDPWVLGQAFESSEATRAQRDTQLRELRNQYFRAYVGAWTSFIGSIAVRSSTTNEETLADLQSLTRGAPQPYRLLFQQVQYHAILSDGSEDEANSEVADAAQQSFWRRVRARIRRLRGGQVVDNILGGGRRGQDDAATTAEALTSDWVYLQLDGFTRFGASPPQPAPAEGQAPPPEPQLDVATYEQQLASVRDALQAHLNTPRGTQEALQTALQTALTTTQSLIWSQEEGMRPFFRNLLRPPIAGTVSTTATTQASGTGNTWCTEVYTPYHRNIEGSYPLNPSGHDIPLSDFAAFYGREGTLWAYYDGNLQRSVPHIADQFEFAQRLDQQASRSYRPELLQYLQRAHDITSVFFPPGADGPTVEYDVRVRPSVRVATQTFCAGGQCEEYHNGPERWVRFSWPGEEPVAGASLELRGADGIHERIEQGGEWGLFRLLESGTITSRSNGNRVFTVTWRLRTHQVDVMVDIRPVRGDAPFFGVLGRDSNAPLLQPLRATHADPPREIVLGRSVCPVR